MPQVYVTKLTLRCTPMDATTTAEFENRWTSSLSNSWKALEFNYDQGLTQTQNEAALAAHLTGIIETQFTVTTTWFSDDIQDTSGSSYVGPTVAFAQSDWMSGGPTHTADMPVKGTLTGGSTPQWKFLVTGQSDGSIFAKASWKLETRP